jgi:hypothetical protein
MVNIRLTTICILIGWTDEIYYKIDMYVCEMVTINPELKQKYIFKKNFEYIGVILTTPTYIDCYKFLKHSKPIWPNRKNDIDIIYPKFEINCKEIEIINPKQKKSTNKEYKKYKKNKNKCNEFNFDKVNSFLKSRWDEVELQMKLDFICS